MHEFYMKEALLEAKKAYDMGEVPIGAVVVKDGKIIGRGHNLRESENRATAHAEVIAIEQACKAIDSWRLLDSTLYVTLEPCPMCTGAIINSRIENLVFGALDEKAGAVFSKISLFECDFNHKPKIKYGVLQNECSGILKEFFKELR